LQEFQREQKKLRLVDVESRTFIKALDIWCRRVDNHDVGKLHEFSEILGKVPRFPKVPKSSQKFPKILKFGRNLYFFTSEVEAESPITLQKIIFKRVRVRSSVV
jgi:hypothetical protein